MSNKSGKLLILPLLLSAATVILHAQGEAKYELGAGVVGSFYDKRTFTSPAGSAEAGFKPGYGASAWLGNNMYNRISGELRYDYLRNSMKLEGNGGKAEFSGESHAIHYDLHYHFADKDAPVRPYVLAGGGVKLFRGIGKEQPFQPLSDIGVLTHTNEVAGLITFGAGVKMQVSERVMFRVEFRDNFTRFPKKVIAPNRATGASGWTHNFLPTAGLSVLF